MALALGFSSGVMILVSFVELLAEGIAAVGFMPAHLAFFAGMGGMFLLDLLIPHHYIAEHAHPGEDDDPQNEGLLRTGLLTALGIGLHNFPEGMVTFVAALVLGPVPNDATFGYVLALVGGFMVFISLDELVPAAEGFDSGHTSILGVVAGMVLMAVSLEMLA